MTTETACYVTEQTTTGTYMELSRDEAERLEHAGLLIQSENDPNGYDVTALVWDDLGLDGDKAVRLLTAALGTRRSTLTIEWSDDAAESYAETLDGLAGYLGDVTTEDGATFPARLRGRDDSANWYPAMHVERAIGPDYTESGTIETVNVERFRVY